MKKYILLTGLLVIIHYTYGQSINDTVKLDEVIVSSNKIPIELKKNPGTISYVTPQTLAILPKTIGTDEALRLVPGVRVDNQHDGERIHLSIRGQGILTERGIRGIGIFLDGIPENDPSGFAPDMYDVDWASVRKVEVSRGPATGLYGSSGAGGVISIYTKNGGAKPIGGEVSQIAGTNCFTKTFIQLGGSKDHVNYRLAYSRTDGDGYRIHQAFWSNKFYEKLNFYPTKNLYITQIAAHTDYFQQNPEGLNLQQVAENPRQANPDAVPYNEYQKTNRNKFGLHAKYFLNKHHDFDVMGYLYSWRYKETSNKCAEYRDITNPGFMFQYNLHFETGSVRHSIGAGTDLKWQTIDMYKLQSAPDTSREDNKKDETNIETDSLLANQIINQQSMGLYVIYNLEFGKFTLIGNIRYDAIENKLTDKMMRGDTAVTSKNFYNTSSRIGISYNFFDELTVFVNWSQGFLPPSTEELASNPVGYSGFNTHLVPATANSIEVGARGFFGEKLYYGITGFDMKTKNDFFRFKQSGRGNQEVFYGNAGNSTRLGIETYISYHIIEQLNLRASYTYSDFKYISASIDPIYTDTAYVQTKPPEQGQYLPNSPKHQLYAEIVYTINKNFQVSFATQYQSEWAIYTDPDAYYDKLDPAVYQNWQKGFTLFHARASYHWKIRRLNGECSIFVRNLTDTQYIAFTEPDPDGNSYHPGPGREIFGSVKIRFD
ncbi:MAG: TonB-dependent receptor [Chlorobi bacterium]|nr:TonB-dependent receptor [Chlorobiota bacterium]